VPANFPLHQQRARLGFDLIAQPVGGVDAVLGDVQPGLEQIVFRTGGMSNRSRSATTRAVVRPMLPGRVA
jgi:hypothetical protein